MDSGFLSTVPVIPRYDPRPGFDSEALIRITGGNTSLAEELVNMLLNELPTRKADIHGALQEDDLDRLVAVSHTLCGGAAYCGALRLKDLSRILEEAANGGDKNRISTAVRELDTEIGHLLESTSRD